MTASGKRQLSAILFADIVGFTALMQRDEDRARAQRDRQRESLERHISANNGHLVQYFGDGTLAMFDSSVAAVEAAVASPYIFAAIAAGILNMCRNGGILLNTL